MVLLSSLKNNPDVNKYLLKVLRNTRHETHTHTHTHTHTLLFIFALALSSSLTSNVDITDNNMFTQKRTIRNMKI